MNIPVAEQRAAQRTSLRVVPAAMLSLSGFLLFALHQQLFGYALLAAALGIAALVDRALIRDLMLIDV